MKMEVMKVFDLTTAGDDVKSCAAHLWRHLELGNDYYYYTTCLSDLEEIDNNGVESKTFVWSEEGYPVSEGSQGWYEITVSIKPIIDALKEYVSDENEHFLLHWWW